MAAAAAKQERALFIVEPVGFDSEKLCYGITYLEYVYDKSRASYTLIVDICSANRTSAYALSHRRSPRQRLQAKVVFSAALPQRRETFVKSGFQAYRPEVKS